MGKESKTIRYIICITDSLCCAAEANITLQINYHPIQNYFKIKPEFTLKTRKNKNKKTVALTSSAGRETQAEESNSDVL